MGFSDLRTLITGAKIDLFFKVYLNLEPFPDRLKATEFRHKIQNSLSASY